MLDQKNKFKAKIFKVFILVSLAPLLIISVSNIYVILLTRQQNIAELQDLAITGTSEKVKKFLNDEIEALNLVLNTDPSNLIEVDINTLNRYIDFIKTKAGAVNEISFIDKSGIEVVKRSELEDTELRNVSDEDFFQQAAINKKYFGEVEIVQSGASMIIASQVENMRREMIGVIMADIDLSRIQKTVDDTRLGNEGYVYLADASSSAIFAPFNTDLMEKDDDIKAISQKGSLTGSSYNTFTNKQGEEIIFGERELGIAGWKIFTYWPKKDAYAVVNNILYQSYIILFATLVLIIVLSLIMTRQIVKPIVSLSKGAKEISEGNLEHRIDLKTGDEFETLGEEFNNMIEVLKENKKLKDEFVFIAAHELRTPVTAIKGYVSMMLDGTFGEVEDVIKNNLKIVYGANERLVQLVQDLLEIARSESGKMKIEVKPLLLVDNITTVINELRSIAEPKGIKIIYQKPETDYSVMADEAKLKEVLVNLIGNAVKYTLAGGDVEISHEVKDSEVITHIKDHGIGIDDENLQKLFSKFFRVKTSKTTNIEGTGLGLFICKEIIERMEGSIWAVSEEGKGSIFSFSLKAV